MQAPELPQIDGRSSSLAIVGPTGIGKSSLAQALALATGAELVACDSVQIYAGFNLGSAKPSAADRLVVPHHLLDVARWDDPFDAQRYADLAGAALDAIAGRQRPAILCGGTGLYLQALRYGLAPLPPADPDLRRALEATEQAQPGALHAQLQRLDPVTAARLHPASRQHVLRAVELCLQAGEPASQLRARHGFSVARRAFTVVVLSCSPERLRQQIEARLTATLAAGWVEEVAALRREGVTPDARPMRAVGYAEIGAMLDGALKPAHLHAKIAQRTWQYARRQRIWWRRAVAVQVLDLDVVVDPMAYLRALVAPAQ